MLKSDHGRSRTSLPIHFLTIVLNGEPFIRHHIDVLKALRLPWHWHIVEGVAALNHDTAWSCRHGGTIGSEFHNGGLSIDGTTAYLDELAAHLPLVIGTPPPRLVVADGRLGGRPNLLDCADLLRSATPDARHQVGPIRRRPIACARRGLLREDGCFPAS